MKIKSEPRQWSIDLGPQCMATLAESEDQPGKYLYTIVFIVKPGGGPCAEGPTITTLASGYADTRDAALAIIKPYDKLDSKTLRTVIKNFINTQAQERRNKLLAQCKQLIAKHYGVCRYCESTVFVGEPIWYQSNKGVQGCKNCINIEEDNDETITVPLPTLPGFNPGQDWEIRTLLGMLELS
jgi:hypothetical protein